MFEVPSMQSLIPYEIQVAKRPVLPFRRMSSLPAGVEVGLSAVVPMLA